MICEKEDIKNLPIYISGAISSDTSYWDKFLEVFDYLCMEGYNLIINPIFLTSEFDRKYSGDELWFRCMVECMETLKSAHTQYGKGTILNIVDNIYSSGRRIEHIWGIQHNWRLLDYENGGVTNGRIKRKSLWA